MSESEQNISKQPLLDRILLRWAQAIVIFVAWLLSKKEYHMEVSVYKFQEKEEEERHLTIVEDEDGK